MAVMAVVSVIIVAALFTLPREKSDDAHDFSEFYAAAQIVGNGLGRNLYNIDLQAEFISRVAAVHAFYERPPFESLMFLPLTFFSYGSAFMLWMVISLSILAGTTWMIESQTKASLAVSLYTGIRADFGLLFVLFLTFGPATTGLLIGQDSMLVLLVYTLVFVLFRGNAPFAAGCVLALGLFKFQFIVPFVLIQLIRRKWRLIGGFAAVGGLLILLSIAICGFQALIGYPKFLLFDNINQKVAGFQPEFMPNIRGIVYFLLNRWAAPSLLNISVLILSLLTIWFAAKHWRDDRLSLSFSVAVIAALLTSYHLYIYDLTLLLLPVAITCGELARQKRLLTSPPLLPAILIIMFIHPLHSVMVRYSIYALMFVPVFVLFVTIVHLNEFVQGEP